MRDRAYNVMLNSDGAVFRHVAIQFNMLTQAAKLKNKMNFLVRPLSQ